MPTDNPDLKYDQDLVAVWRRGALNSVILQPLDAATSISLRARLYKLRKQLTRDKHDAARLAWQATIKRVPMPTEADPNNWALIIHPAQMGFEQALINAGVKKQDEPPPLE